MSELHPNIQQLLSELFINPFVEQLIEQYSEQTLENKDLVILLLEGIKYSKLYFPLVSFLDKRVTRKNNDPIISSLESLWKLYHNQVDLSRVFGKEILPPENRLRSFIDIVLKLKIVEYYGQTPPLSNNVTIEKANLHSREAINFALTSDCQFVHYTLGKSIQLHKKYAALPYSIIDKKDSPNFSYCDFRGKNFRRLNLLGWIISESDLSGAQFEGDGTTRTCIHWTALNCNFCRATFVGSLCHKTSTYDGSNFSGAELTALLANCGLTSMKNCNFTGARISPIPVGKTFDEWFASADKNSKISGTELLDYLGKVRQIPMEGSYVLNNGAHEYFDEGKLDASVWKT